jgi:alkylation response protein AidB-like acyl-CoA dehydrogenase
MKGPLSRSTLVELTSSLTSLSDPRTPDEHLALLRLLYSVGRRDLPLGRLLEGHVDARQIVARYGTPTQRAGAEDAVRAGAAFGVWNADLSGEPLILAGGRLAGGKAFASGAGLLTHALVSFDAEGGRQLLLLDLARTPPVIDRSWWRVTGMQRSETHIVRWDDAPVASEALIGVAGDYLREPFFSGGAIRFAAVQAGGIAGVVDAVRDHLVAQRREQDQVQRGRLADLFNAAQAAADAVSRAAHGWSAEDVSATLALVAAARNAVYSAGETVLTLAQAAVGLQAMFVDHPLAERLTDLAVYLRQPAPDVQRGLAGEAVAAGLLSPGL